LNRKITLSKGKINQKNEDQIKKNKTTKALFEWWNWNQNVFNKRAKKKNLKKKNKDINERKKAYEKLQLKD
jgi:hypothetical protein